jgi:glycosyltransferase involved in cell wall biosynthesis
MDVSIVIPYFDEGATWPRLLEALDASEARLAALGKRSEVVLVDDGSRDGSWPALRAAAGARPWLHLIRLRRNFGQTAAMAAGFRAARGDIVVPMDADLQNDPSDIPRLLAKLDEGYDVVSGWRRERKDALLSRRLPSRIANWLVGRVSGLRLHDTGCTLKAYRRTFLEGVSLYGEMHRFIPLFAHWQGARVTELEVSHHARREGRSKYGLGRTFNVLMDLVTVKFLGDFSTKPLYFFGKTGALFCLAGTLVAALTLYEKYFTAEHVWVHKNPLFGVAVFLFMLGVQLVMMGLLAELQVRTYHEAQGKPTYLVGETVNGEPAASERAVSLLDARK